MLDAHVRKAGDGAGSVIGVQGAEHQVAGERRAHGDLRGLEIADFSDHDDVRVLANNVAQARRKGQPDLGIHMDLVDTRQLVLDRILHRDDLLVRWYSAAARNHKA